MKIGLEIHVQLETKSKLFCTCPTNFLSAPPNTNICPICTGQPGAKPMGINREALKKAVLLALALNCKINPGPIRFLRKHYFYPDLPNNYQRTSEPIGVEGKLGKVRIREIHLEEDPGRYDLRRGLVDYNRSGIPLVEIVTEPDMESPEEMKEFLKDLLTLLDYLGIVKKEGNIFRADVNVSIPGGTRVEIKNVNSIESAVKAVLFEVARQKRLLAEGKKIARETRHFDEVRGVTVSLREKETAEDYRYIPDPDIPPFYPAEVLEEAKAELPELPWEREEKFASLGLPRVEAKTLVRDKALADLFEDWIKKYEPREVSKFLVKIVRAELNYRGLRFAESRLSTTDLEKLFTALQEGRISWESATEVVRGLLDGKIEDVDKAIAERTILSVSDDILRMVLEENKKAVQDFLSGKEEALNFLIGAVMKKLRGRADPKDVRKRLLRLLQEFKG